MTISEQPSITITKIVGNIMDGNSRDGNTRVSKGGERTAKVGDQMFMTRGGMAHSHLGESGGMLPRKLEF